VYFWEVAAAEVSRMTHTEIYSRPALPIMADSTQSQSGDCPNGDRTDAAAEFAASALLVVPFASVYNRANNLRSAGDWVYTDRHRRGKLEIPVIW
jgi:hypothetical protein